MADSPSRASGASLLMARLCGFSDLSEQRAYIPVDGALHSLQRRVATSQRDA